MSRIYFRLKSGNFSVVLLCIAICGCSKSNHEDTSAVFSAIHPWRDKVQLNRQYVAQIRAIQHIELRAFEKGYLQDIFVDEGTAVKKDQKMFQIMPILMNAEYKRAKAEYEISKIEYNNTKLLADRQVVSPSELSLAKARFEKFEAELNLAKAHLDLTLIKAPFDGIMDRFRGRLGSLVEEGELLTTLSDISKLWVYFNVSEADYLAYTANKKDIPNAIVNLVMANGQPYKYPGQIDTIEADFNNETGNIPFRATFPNPELTLRHGETGNVLLSKTLENALVIPQKATFEVLDKKYVYVVDAKGTLDARQITIENEVPTLFVISGGITEADTILLEGLGKVNKGQTIKTKILTKSHAVRGLALQAE